MNISAWVKFTAPLLIASLLLFGLGVAAAWNVQHQQVTTSELVAREVRTMIAEQDFHLDLREIRILIFMFLRTGDSRLLEQIPSLSKRADRHVTEIHNLAKTAGEKSNLQQLRSTFETFQNRYLKIVNSHDWPKHREELETLVDDVLTEKLVLPTRQAVDTNRRIVDRTNQVNRETTDQMRQGFLLLGLTGGAGGIIMGLTLAHNLRRTILQLNVSVSGAAGKLQEVVGPLQLSPFSQLHDLHSGLEEMERRIKQVVERLQQREREVLHNEQLAAIGQLAAGMAHELRNPLMPMKMLVQAALERGDEAGLHGRQLQVLAEEISRLEASIQMFLDFARPPKLEAVRCDLRTIVKQTLDLIAARAEQLDIRLSIEQPEAPCWLEGDPVQLRQVMLNLVLNAFDEMPDGGSINVTIAARTDAVGWRLEIKDSGPGIPAEILPRIWEPFVSDKETGTGLGLPICRRIIEAHAGTIRADNCAEGGTSMTIDLPLAIVR